MENKPLIDLTDEQRSTIYRFLTQLNLDEFQDFLEEVLRSGDYALGLMLIKTVKEKVELDTRTKLLDLQNMKLQSITGGMIKMSWIR